MTTNNAVNSPLSGTTGTGSFVGSTSPTLVTPALGIPASGTLTNCTGYVYSNVTQKPMLIANTSTTSIDGTTPTIVFTSAPTNISSAYNTGTGEYTAPANGRYLCACTVRFNSAAIGAGGIQRLWVFVNGSGVALLDERSWSSVTAIVALSGTCLVNVSASDVITFRAFNNSTTALDGGSNSTCAYIEWIST